MYLSQRIRSTRLHNLLSSPDYHRDILPLFVSLKHLLLPLLCQGTESLSIYPACPAFRRTLVCLYIIKKSLPYLVLSSFTLETPLLHDFRGELWPLFTVLVVYIVLVGKSCDRRVFRYFGLKVLADIVLQMFWGFFRMYKTILHRIHCEHKGGRPLCDFEIPLLRCESSRRVSLTVGSGSFTSFMIRALFRPSVYFPAMILLNKEIIRC